MSDFTFKHRDCHRADGTRKRQWTKKREAKLVAQRIGGGVQVYRCRFCRCYHVGNPQPPGT